MRKLPIGIQDFGKLRDGGYLYVDKTEAIHRLVTEGAVYFLSRPRRFGKSLLISTLDALFSGRRDLFEGLWIANEHAGSEPWAFEPGPVVRLDMNAKEYRQGRAFLIEHLAMQVGNAALRLGIQVRGVEPVEQFANLLFDAHGTLGKRVTVLIDEYDKPLLETLDDPELHREMRSALKAFYGVLKSADEHLRFAFITGVTKFSQVSVFSDLNHLRDISRTREYAELCGITQDELERYFEPELRAFAEQEREPDESEVLAYRQILTKMRQWYDGYLFHERGMHVYNPFATLNVLLERRFENYWFRTGTPTFLLRLLREYPLPLENLESVRMPVASFSEIDPERIGPIAVLFQAGYLTIAAYSPSTEEYELRYPNREVQQSLLRALVDGFAPLGFEWQTQNILGLLVRHVRDGDVESFMTHLRAFFANIPYDLHIPRERYYQTIFYLIFRLIGFNVQAEVKHATGRTDAIVETAERVYLFEFKLDRASAEDALRQIDDKSYATPYIGTGKQIVKIGVAFDSDLKNIDRWVVG